MDADGDTVVRLVAANLTDEFQDGVDGRGDIVVWPVFIVELADSAGFLQEEKSAGRVRGRPTAPRGCCRSSHGHQLGRRHGKGKLACCRHLQFPSASAGKG